MKFSWGHYRVASYVDPTAEEARELEPNGYYALIAESGEQCSFAYGGQCEKTALCEVYGLPFCESHGPEAAAVALFEERDEAREALCDLASSELEMLRTNRSLASALEYASEKGLGEACNYDQLLEKLPLRHSLDLIDEDSKRRYDEGCRMIEDPEDEWRDRLRDVVRAMRIAWSTRAFDEVIGALEPIRQQAMSQLQIVMRYAAVHREAIYEGRRRVYEK